MAWRISKINGVYVSDSQFGHVNSDMSNQQPRGLVDAVSDTIFSTSEHARKFFYSICYSVFQNIE
jgi:hypothetical protein